jgi:hypothetical protein
VRRTNQDRGPNAKRLGPICLCYSVMASIAFLFPLGYGQPSPKYVVLPSPEASKYRTLYGLIGGWQPTDANLKQIEEDLPEVSRLPAKNRKPDQYVVHPEQYDRQYIGVFSWGTRMVLVNAFCRAPEYWHQHVVFVFDGGSCYWQALYDPGTRRFSELRINGIG